MIKKILSHILILVMLAMIFAPVYVGAQATGGGTVNPPLGEAANTGIGSSVWTYFTNALGDIFASILYIVLTIIAFILYIAGTLLDFVLKYTIIDLKLNLESLTGINIAWKVIKDLMNIAFIFILIYKGIELIIGVGSKESIKNFISALVIAALLVNFSLFFTRVLIDASNIVTLGFYKTIVESSGGSIPITLPTGQTALNITGISVPFMTNLGLTTFWGTDGFDAVRTSVGGNWNMVLTPLIGIFLFLITAMVFVAVAAIFIIRYIVLIILLILSPIAYMGSALPFLGKYSKDWWSTFSGQLLFGPLYMIMTWIVLTLMSTSGFISANRATWGQLVNGEQIAANLPYQQSPIGLVFNFAILIGLIVASLVVSKRYASQGSKQLSKFTDMASDKAGSAVFGGTAWIGRRTLGYAGSGIASSADLQSEASRSRKGVWDSVAGATARTVLYSARTARDATYDGRNASVPTSMIGDVIRGTLGRTEKGKAMGLNDVNTGSIPIMGGVSDSLGAGKGGTTTYESEKKESSKRVRDRETADNNELAVAQAKEKIKTGSINGASATEIEEMEKALAKLTDKQTAELVDGNRELLDSQNFANALSIKQLEALNKNDLLDDSDKQTLKDSRFFSINQGMQTMRTNPGSMTAAQTSALHKEIRSLGKSELEMLDSSYFSDDTFVNNLKPSQIEAINKSDNFSTTQKEEIHKVRFSTIITAMGAGGAGIVVPNSPAASAIKSLTDSELETINRDYLTNPTFVAQLKSSQIEAVTKSNDFTRVQKDNLKALRRAPLDAALAAGNGTVAIGIVQGMSPEEVAALGRNAAGQSIIRDAYLQPAYTPNMLKRMAAKMTTGDIQALRGDLLSAGAGTKQDTIDWLEDPAGGVVDFS